MTVAAMTFRLSVLNADKVIYDGEVRTVFITGDKTEYELLPYHSPLMGVMNRCNILVDQHLLIPVESGLVKFHNNKCVIIAEEIPLEPLEGFDTPEHIEEE